MCNLSRLILVGTLALLGLLAACQSQSPPPQPTTVAPLSGATAAPGVTTALPVIATAPAGVTRVPTATKPPGYPGPETPTVAAPKAYPGTSQP